MYKNKIKLRKKVYLIHLIKNVLIFNLYYLWKSIKFLKKIESFLELNISNNAKENLYLKHVNNFLIKQIVVLGNLILKGLH